MVVGGVWVVDGGGGGWGGVDVGFGCLSVRTIRLKFSLGIIVILSLNLI